MDLICWSNQLKINDSINESLNYYDYEWMAWMNELTDEDIKSFLF